MHIIQSVILGAIQGLAEFIPISSSAHLALAHHFFHWEATGGDPRQADLVFDVMLHAGTLIALLLYFWKDWQRLLFDPSQRKMLQLILVACIPGAVAGVLLEKRAEDVFREPWRIALLLGIAGLVLLWSDHATKKVRDLDSLDWKDSLWVGLSQAFAVMPGVSRSGATITAGLFLGMTRETAARFSFLISMPIIAGASLYEGRHLIHGFGGLAPSSLAAGILTAAVTGYAAISFLLAFLRTRTMTAFVVYRIAVAVVVLAAVILTR